MIHRDLIFYIKTTETCQLNCDHCFTNGSNGQKGFFDENRVIDFMHKLKNKVPQINSGSVTFHGGEPMLCPPEKMIDLWQACRDLWPSLFWSIQTNLTYKIDPIKLTFFEKVCQKTWGTSWDYDLRWKSKRSSDLWRSNIKELAQDGHNITVIVSLSKKLLQEKEPIEVIEDLAELGVKHVNFERITSNGNAIANKRVFPSNKDLDHWFDKMWRQSVNQKTYQYIDNLFFDSILTSAVFNTFSGCRCRQCEQKVFTINADGSIGGCPNTAAESPFAHINENIDDILFNPGRLCNIEKESRRNQACYTCEVYDICNGDCHQLAWENGVCAAPKTLMSAVKKSDKELLNSFLNGFQGQE
ncbi:MAG: hypothetical protein CME65_02315 [Halobacteriovoraceae bacterium]|nr:hypothetical protein [Halobacteriovoraceae bacterium]|tara:strand:+ start:4928 stop:5998 length:1071 start_codon:yes stop_codon:yes gene_type:complete